MWGRPCFCHSTEYMKYSTLPQTDCPWSREPLSSPCDGTPWLWYRDNRGFLPQQQYICDILPPVVTGENDEQIRMAMVAVVCHGILSLLMHVVRSLVKDGGSTTIWPSWAASASSPRCYLGECSSQLHLVVPNVVQPLSLYFGVLVNQKLDWTGSWSAQCVWPSLAWPWCSRSRSLLWRLSSWGTTWSCPSEVTLREGNGVPSLPWQNRSGCHIRVGLTDVLQCVFMALRHNVLLLELLTSIHQS